MVKVRWTILKLTNPLVYKCQIQHLILHTNYYTVVVYIYVLPAIQV